MKKLLIFGVIMAAAFAAGCGSTYIFNKPAPSETDNLVQEIYNLSPEQFNTLMNTGRYMLLDIRTAGEYTAGHLKNAKQIDFYQTKVFSDYLDTLNKKAKYLIYCRTGNRTATALKIMKEKGFTNVSDLTGGYNQWVSKNLPTEK